MRVVRAVRVRWLVLAAFAIGIIVGGGGAVAIDRSTGDDGPSAECILLRSTLENPQRLPDAKTVLTLAESYDKGCR